MKTRNAVRQAIVLALLIVASSYWADYLAAAPQSNAHVDHELEGYASWYAGKFQGRTTASGEVFDTNEMTAAHKTLPFGTIVEVTHRERGTSVEVRINDRGPFVEGRIIDLSRAAADALRMTAEGVAPVTLRIISYPDPPARRIQVAAFADRANAVRLRDRLRDEGVPADVETAPRVYRVVIRNVPDDETESMVKQLAELGHHEVLIRAEPKAPEY
jgi:rare lipoprotein A